MSYLILAASGSKHFSRYNGGGGSDRCANRLWILLLVCPFNVSLERRKGGGHGYIGEIGPVSSDNSSSQSVVKPSREIEETASESVIAISVRTQLLCIWP
jgi:hypothetical protein